ncbi:MAG: DUF1045 domain-containing protein [Desulfovibrio sp.]|jgi:hypothetical protein|nr:DUF1045 domain-containing protein [Desulfovibrio sp.]
MRQKPPRYAIYYVPERDTALERLGSSLLGRDICTGDFLPQPGLRGIAPDGIFMLTRDARRYGLHATLKPPFFLKPGVTEDELIKAAERFGKARRALSLPALALDRIGSFFALAMHPRDEAEAEDAEKVRFMAREAVISFDGFRAPPSVEELDRRRSKGLSPRQEEYLLQWGYPYVLDEFCFHITLTDSVRHACLAAVLEAGLRRYMVSAVEDNRIRAIAVCRSDVAGNFTLLRRMELAGDAQSP